MPIVFVNYDKNRLPITIQGIVRKLPIIVATALDSSGSDDDGLGDALREDNIEVIVRESHPLDVNSTSLSIIIFANDFPKRKENLQERTDNICARIKSNLPKETEFSVRVMLVPSRLATRAENRQKR